MEVDDNIFIMLKFAENTFINIINGKFISY